MTIDRKLAWGALLIGIAGLVPAFKEAGWLWASPLILLLFGIGGYLVYSEWSSTRTAVAVLSLEKCVVIHRDDGSLATLTRTQTIRVNQGWLHEYWFRNMVTDGSFGNLRIDNEAPAQTSHLGCLMSYSKRFTPPLSKGTVREIKLECPVHNCFPNHEEGLLHDVAQDTHLLILKVELPASRTCKVSSLLLEAAGEPARELEKPEISLNRRSITAKIERPRTGFTYHLHWTW